MRSMTSTVGVQNSQYISGTSSRSSPAKLRRNWLPLAASRIRSSSSCRYLSNSATTSRGFRRLPSAHRRSAHTAMSRSNARSESITGSMFGRSTFTATALPACCPALTVAKCTCAIEALATGTRSKSSNSTSTGAPSAFSTSPIATAESNGGT